MVSFSFTWREGGEERGGEREKEGEGARAEDFGQDAQFSPFL